MKDWVKKLDFNSISSLAKKKGILDNVPDAVDEKIFRAIAEREEVPQKNPFAHPVLGYALTAAVLIIVLIPLLLFLGSQKKAPLAELVLSSGKAYYIRQGVRGGAEQVITANTHPQKGDSFFTEKRSKQVLRFGENALVQLSEKSRFSLLDINKDEVKISLAAGSLFVDIEKKNEIDLQMTVLAPGVSLRCSESVFNVATTGNKNTITVYKGSVFGELKNAHGIDEDFRINQGEQLIIESGLSFKTQLHDSELQSLFNDFLKFKLKKQLKSPAHLSLSIPMESVLLKINERPVDVFSNQITVNLEAGELALVLEKEGYHSYTKEIKLEENETRHLVVPLLIKNTDDGTGGTSFDSNQWLDELQADVTYSCGQNKSKPCRFLGFNSDNKILVGLTQFSVISMNQDGKVIWEKDFSKNNDIIFDTIPLINNQKIYIPANYQILVLDTQTGSEIKRIKAPGIVSYGYQMVIYQDRGYIPYPEGIYILDLATDAISETPFIAFENPSTPLFFKGNIYVSSFFKSEMALFDFSGKKKAEIRLDDISMSSPVARGNSLFLGDMSGNLYQFDPLLKLSRPYQLENGVTAILCTEKILFVLTKSGELHSFSSDTFKQINSLILDHKPDIMNYLYKKPVLLNNFLVMGSETGEVVFINSETAELVKSMKVIDSAVTTSFISFGKAFFAGTGDGKIIRLK